MNSPTSPVKTWTQTSLFPPEVLEIRLLVGVCDRGNHVQIQVEQHDPSSGALVSMWSRPHVNPDKAMYALEESLEMVRQALAAAVHPFPTR